MTELDKQGIERVMMTYGGRAVDITRRDIEIMIKTYLTEPPKWPTDESAIKLVAATSGPYAPRDLTTEDARTVLREPLLADPIIKAAIALRDRFPNVHCSPDAPLGTSDAIVNAVKEAGL